MGVFDGEAHVAVMAANVSLTGLSRKHRVKVCSGSVLNVEEVALAVGQRIGHISVKSAVRINRVVVLFLKKVIQVNILVDMGITVNQPVCSDNSADAACSEDHPLKRIAVHQ